MLLASSSSKMGSASRPFLGRAIQSPVRSHANEINFVSFMLVKEDKRERGGVAINASPVLQFGIHHGAVVF
jgi:hypothetical protein